MRSYSDTLAYRASLIGSVNAALTAIGAPVDTIGFSDVMAIISAAAVVGSNTSYLDCKIQECATLTGTGGAWTDITDGVPCGSFAFGTMTFAGTDPAVAAQKVYAHVGAADANRKRYIRPLATCSGTVGVGIKFSINFLLGRAQQSGYIVADKTASTYGTGNTDTTWNKQL